MPFKQGEIAKIQSLFDEYEEITVYCDGSSIGNPGLSGAGIAITGRKMQEEK